MSHKFSMSIVLCIGGRAAAPWFEKFQGKRKLLKNPECYKIFQCSEKFYGKLCFSRRRVAQKSLMIKNIFNTAKNFRAKSVFQGKRKLLKNPER